MQGFACRRDGKRFGQKRTKTHQMRQWEELMNRSIKQWTLAALASLAVLPTGMAAAADIELLPAALLSPTTQEKTKPDQYKKEGPWTIGMSFPGLGNTWIIQMVHETKFTAGQ